MSASRRVPPLPAVLRLVQTSVVGRWRATSEELYREVARVTEAGRGKELLVSGCGDGITAEWLATRTGASVSGVDASAENVELAEVRARSATPPMPITYQQAALDDLPHETAVFDIAVGEPALSAAADPGRAVGELARVTRPGGAVLLLQPTWSSAIAAEVRDMVVERLRMRPHLVIEWKQMLRVAGVGDVQVQDWTSGAPGHPKRTPAGGGPAMLTWRQKMQIMGRAWRRWGWHEARDAVERETAVLRALMRDGAIGFHLIKGVKWPHAKSP